MPPAELFQFPPRRDGNMPPDAVAILQRLAKDAAEAGADPAASVNPDHNLLLLSASIVIAKRQHDHFQATWRAMAHSHPDYQRAYEEWRRAGRTVKGMLLKLRKLSATTPAGLFAKAAAVSRAGSSAAISAVSLADDLLASPELRAAIWRAGRGRDS